MDKEVYTFIGKHLDLIHEPSMRLYVNAMKMKKAGLDWKKAFLSSIELRVCSERVGGRFRRVGETHRSSVLPGLCVGGLHPPYNRQTRLSEQTLSLTFALLQLSPRCLPQSVSANPISTRNYGIQCPRDHYFRKSLILKELRKGAEDKLRTASALGPDPGPARPERDRRHPARVRQRRTDRRRPRARLDLVLGRSRPGIPFSRSRFQSVGRV